MSRMATMAASLACRHRWMGAVARSSSPARVGSVAFVRAYAITMRPYLLFVSGITGICGLACAAPLPAGRTLVLAAAFLLSYGFGQALTDCFQMDTDALSSPYRPLVRGDVRRRDVGVVSLLGLAACGLVMAWARPLNLILCVMCVAGLATYTFFKRRWWGGPPYNAAIVALAFVIALVAGGAGTGVGIGVPTTPAAPGSRAALLLGALATIFFGYADFVLTGYFKDVSADRATGYRTLPVVFGLRRAARVADVLAVLTLAGTALALTGAGFPRLHAVARTAVWLLSLAGAAALVVGHRRLHRVKTEAEAHRAIEPVLHAGVLLPSAIAAAARPDWTPALVVLYAAFVVALRCRPVKEQI